MRDHARSALSPYTTLFRSYLVFEKGGVLLAMGFDAASLTRSGEPFRIMDSVLLAATTGSVARVAESSEEHTSELQPHSDFVCRLLLQNKNIASLRPVSPRR